MFANVCVVISIVLSTNMRAHYLRFICLICFGTLSNSYPNVLCIKEQTKVLTER